MFPVLGKNPEPMVFFRFQGAVGSTTSIVRRSCVRAIESRKSAFGLGGEKE
jgi:hypothetical protein